MRLFSLPVFIGLLLSFFTPKVTAQELRPETMTFQKRPDLGDTLVLKYTPGQIEALFLEQNLQLVAEKMNISLADAEMVQAKLWDNPELSVSSVNLWSSREQRNQLETSAFPKNTQFSIELSQLIRTANKRGKLHQS